MGNILRDYFLVFFESEDFLSELTEIQSWACHLRVIKSFKYSCQDNRSEMFQNSMTEICIFLGEIRANSNQVGDYSRSVVLGSYFLVERLHSWSANVTMSWRGEKVKRIFFEIIPYILCYYLFHFLLDFWKVIGHAFR